MATRRFCDLCDACIADDAAYYQVSLSTVKRAAKTYPNYDGESLMLVDDPDSPHIGKRWHNANTEHSEICKQCATAILRMIVELGETE